MPEPELLGDPGNTGCFDCSEPLALLPFGFLTDWAALLLFGVWLFVPFRAFVGETVIGLGLPL